LFSCFLF